MITVFLGTFNRLSTLTRTIRSYRGLNTPYEIVVVDNGSDHPDCVKLLAKVEGLPEVRSVVRLGKAHNMDDVSRNLAAAIKQTKQNGGTGEWMAVTDADVCFDGTDPDALNAYIALAEATGYAVGPHLRVTDIPDCYPFRPRVLATESRLLYKQRMTWHNHIPYSHDQIDTTFHLFPSTTIFDRLRMNTVRVGPPYDAMHLDWYVDAWNPTPENWIYIPNGGSWSSWLAAFWETFQRSPDEAFQQMLAVTRVPDMDNTSYLISWCFQYGAGTEINVEESKRWLRAAIPHQFQQAFGLVQEDWEAMVYDHDFTCLGWDTPDTGTVAA